jgi:hypothetical protein
MQMEPKLQFGECVKVTTSERTHEELFDTITKLGSMLNGSGFVSKLAGCTKWGEMIANNSG